MSDGESRTGPDRRTVLRRSALLTGALSVGVPAFAGTAAAHQCPKSPGYWKNHVDEWPSRDPDTIGGTWYSHEELVEIMRTPPRGDKGYIMAHQLIAARLNTYLQGEPCIDALRDAFDMESGTPLIPPQRWLRNSDFEHGSAKGKGGPPSGGQRSWVNDEGVDGEPIKDALDAWNNCEFDACRGDD